MVKPRLEKAFSGLFLSLPIIVVTISTTSLLFTYILILA